MPSPAKRRTARRNVVEPKRPLAWNDAPAQRTQTPKLAHIVADRLRRRIVTGELKPGSNLPSEAQLMEQFRISRPALREALRVLEAEALISIGRGTRSGATILEPSMESVAQYGTFYLVANGTTLTEIHEARSLIEPSVVALLAQAPDQARIAQLRQCVASGRAALAAEDFKRAMLAANEFHELLIHFSDNKALALLVGLLHDVAVDNYLALNEIGGDEATRKSVTGKSLDLQEQLIQLIEQGKSDEAGQFWREYHARAGRILTKTGRSEHRVQLASSD